MHIFPESNETKFWSHCLHLQTVSARKANDKSGVINLVFISPSWVMVLKLSKILSFLQFFANVSKKSKAVIAIYVYASEGSRFTLLESCVGYYAIA